MQATLIRAYQFKLVGTLYFPTIRHVKLTVTSLKAKRRMDSFSLLGLSAFRFPQSIQTIEQ